MSWTCVKVPDDRDRAPTDFTALQESIGFGLVPAASHEDDTVAAQWPTAVCLSACGLARVVVRAPSAEPEPALAADRAGVDVFAQSGAGEYHHLYFLGFQHFGLHALLSVHCLSTLHVCNLAAACLFWCALTSRGAEITCCCNYNVCMMMTGAAAASHADDIALSDL